MPQRSHFFYQIKTEAPPSTRSAIGLFQSGRLEPWSEPVRVKRDPRMARALAASGYLGPTLTPAQVINFYESRWHYAWALPVWPKKGIRASLQQPFTIDTDLLPHPPELIEGWYANFAYPVWPKKGLGRQLQRAFTNPDRFLPPADVFVTLDAIETNDDLAEFTIFLYGRAVRASVSVKEISALDGGAISIVED